MSQSGCSAEGMEPFALRVIGDSMAPEFLDGHIIVVDPGYPPMNGVFAVVENGNEVLFGRYRRDGAHCRLEYLNPTYEPVELVAGHRVKGVVTQRNARRRKDMKRYDYSFSE